ncbi:unnamed protein product, partial [Choristocarpus tenellus]
AKDVRRTCSPSHGSSLRHVGRCRRLNKDEILDILANPWKYRLSRTSVLPAEGVRSGTILLCSKEHVTLLKKDGINYVKRNTTTQQGPNRVREDRVKLKVDGRHVINSYSSRGLECPTLQRRRYALEPCADPAAGQVQVSLAAATTPTKTLSTPTSTPNPISGLKDSGLEVGEPLEHCNGSTGGGDHLIHYLDEDEGKRLALLSPFGPKEVAVSLTNPCWLSREKELPPDGDLFLPGPPLPSSPPPSFPEVKECECKLNGGGGGGQRGRGPVRYSRSGRGRGRVKGKEQDLWQGQGQSQRGQELGLVDQGHAQWQGHAEGSGRWEGKVSTSRTRGVKGDLENAVGGGALCFAPEEGLHLDDGITELGECHCQ